MPSSHPSFGVSVFFLSFFKKKTSVPKCNRFYALSGSCLGSTHDQTTTLPSADSSRTYCSHVFDLACIVAAAGHGIPARASTLSRPCSLAIDSARRGASAPERNNIRFRPAHGDHTAGRWARSFSVRHAKAAQLTSRMHAPERIQSARVCRLQRASAAGVCVRTSQQRRVRCKPARRLPQSAMPERGSQRRASVSAQPAWGGNARPPLANRPVGERVGSAKGAE